MSAYFYFGLLWIHLKPHQCPKICRVKFDTIHIGVHFGRGSFTIVYVLVLCLHQEQQNHQCQTIDDLLERRCVGKRKKSSNLVLLRCDVMRTLRDRSAKRYGTQFFGRKLFVISRIFKAEYLGLPLLLFLKKFA